MTNEEIIKGIKERNDNVFQYIIKTCFPDIKKLVLASGGSTMDAEDILPFGHDQPYAITSLSHDFGILFVSMFVSAEQAIS